MSMQASPGLARGLGGCSPGFQRNIWARYSPGGDGWSGRSAAGQLRELPVPSTVGAPRMPWEWMRTKEGWEAPRRRGGAAAAL